MANFEEEFANGGGGDDDAEEAFLSAVAAAVALPPSTPPRVIRTPSSNNNKPHHRYVPSDLTTFTPAAFNDIIGHDHNSKGRTRAAVLATPSPLGHSKVHRVDSQTSEGEEVEVNDVHDSLQTLMQPSLTSSNINANTRTVLPQMVDGDLHNQNDHSKDKNHHQQQQHEKNSTFLRCMKKLLSCYCCCCRHKKKRSTIKSTVWNFDSFIFALRISVSVTVASLFFLIPDLHTNNTWPSASWVYVTACIVGWQPRIDTATVLKKSIQRIGGTIVGAALGFAVGFISLAFDDLQDQTIFMAIMFALHGFFYPYIVDRTGGRGNYAYFLGMFTYGIVVFAFYNKIHQDNPWEAGLWRCINIILGGVIVAVTAMVIWPVSTLSLVVDLTLTKLRLAGQSAEMTLETASQVFANKKCIPTVTDIIAGDEAVAEDELHATYVKNIDGWKETRSLIPLLKYDPWFFVLSQEEQKQFKHHMVVRVARAFRIQLTLVMMDGILRSFSNQSSNKQYTGSMQALEVLCNVGRNAKIILDLASFDKQERDLAVKELLEIQLVRLRFHLARLANEMEVESHVDVDNLQDEMKKSFAVGVPMLPMGHSLHSEREQIILFFQLTEQLVLRVAALHYFCLEMNPDTRTCFCCSSSTHYDGREQQQNGNVSVSCNE